jgi:hypothetical protein
MRTHNLFGLCWIGVAILGLAITLAAFTPGRFVSICEVEANLDRYRGKLLAVRAMLLGGDRHGWILKDEPGDEPCEEVHKQGHAWPPAIAITHWAEGFDLEDGPATFESKTQEIEDVLKKANKLASSDRDLAIVATFVGELRSRQGIQIVRTKEGWYMGNGYAQSGQYPALLVLKTVRDVKVVKKRKAQD